MTRAKQSLVLSRAVYRRMYGEDRLRASMPSRFLAEIPGELVQAAVGSLAEPGETRRYEPDPEISQERTYRRAGPPSRSTRGAARGAGRTKDPLLGTRVRHPQYGIGTITGVEGEGEDRRLTVSFQDYGPKKLIERYANLQLV
jgi:DNA helicase-2/ATP-dependent DNA helicase PcrA